MGSGGGAKPIKQTNEEKALLRAQLLTLSKQDEEIQQRKKRIIQGQYGSFSNKLKSGASTGGGGSPGTGGSRSGIPAQPSGNSIR